MTNSAAVTPYFDARSLAATFFLLVGLAISGASQANPCAGLSINTCALPFPSNAFTAPDGNSATGISVNFPDTAFPTAAYGSLPDSVRPSSIYADADGFAATTPIIFELNQDIPLGAIPQDGGNFIFVFDVDSGERIPIVVDFDRAATEPAGAQNIIYAWPRSRFSYGRTYAAYVWAAIPTESGQSPALPATLVNDWALGQSPFSQFVVPFFNVFGGLAAATEFTVRSEANARSQLDAMVATALSQQHPVSNINIQPNTLWGGNVNTVVFGEVEVTDFRDPSTGELVWFPGFQGFTSDVPFVLTVPSTPAGPNGAPVVIYGHGLGVSKETVLAVSNTNAARGMATLALSQPLHSQNGSEPFIFDILVPSEIERVLALPAQSVIHFTSLLQSIQTAFVGQDWAPWRFEAAIFPDFFDHGDGQPDLDTSFILYEGTSLGGVLGSTFVAQNAQIPAALLQVSGAGTAHTLLNSGFWSSQFSSLLPDTATVPEQAAIYGIATHALDRADASNFVDRIPQNGQSLLSIYTHMDPVVYNPASERLIELTGGTLYGPLQYSVPHIPYSTGPRPADGNGAYQLQGVPAELGDVFSQLNHLLFLSDPGGQAELGGWLEDRLQDAGF